jgi:hypothetical protein
MGGWQGTMSSNYVERRGLFYFKVLFKNLSGGGGGKPRNTSVRIAGHQTDIRTRDCPSTKQRCSPHLHILFCSWNGLLNSLRVSLISVGYNVHICNSGCNEIACCCFFLLVVTAWTRNAELFWILKVKLFLCLTYHYDEDVLGEWRYTPRILEILIKINERAYFVVQQTQHRKIRNCEQVRALRKSASAKKIKYSQI